MAQQEMPATRVVLRTVLIVVTVVITLYLLYLLRKPIGWLLIAAFLAVALSGPVNLLQRRMKRGLAITVVYLGLLAVPIGIGALMVPPLVGSVNDLAENAPEYARDVTKFVEENERLRQLDEDYDLTSKLREQAGKLPERLGGAASTLRDVGLGIVNSIFALVTILILTAFMLGGGRRWIVAGLRYLPEDRAERTERVLERSAAAVGNYVGGALAQATLAALLAYVVLIILGVPFAGPAGADHLLPRPDPDGGRHDRGRDRGCGHALRQLPHGHDHLDHLVDRLPAGGEQPDPATDPEAGGGHQPVPGGRGGAVRRHPAGSAGRAGGGAGGGVDPDRAARVPGRAGDQAAAGAAARDAGGEARSAAGAGARLMHDPDTLGAEFARALAAKDANRLLELLHPEIDFRGLTPNRSWEASDPDAVLSVLLDQWFEDKDRIDSLEQLETDAFADRQRVGYRFEVTNPDGRFVVEQQAYLAARDGRIDWMRVVCSGLRPGDA